MKRILFSMLFVLHVVFAWSQDQTATVTGKVIDSKTQRPIANAVASIQNTTITALTNPEGIFVFTNVAAGDKLLEIRSSGFVTQLLSVSVTNSDALDLGIIVLEVDVTLEQQLSLITIVENDLGDDNSGSESTAGLLQASRDVFQQTAAFNWGLARFRIRGLDNEYGKTMINGISMDKIYDGRPQFGNWGGLNDVTRYQEFTLGSAPSDYTFGGILGTQEINTRASIYRRGSRVTFSGNNTNYNFRTMATYASGMDANGWAFVISAGRRWANEAYFEGTNYSANSFFASIEKRINEKHSINFTSMYAQNRRGRNSPNTEEVNDLAGTRYNSYWGYQDGRKRNSRERNVEEPLFILSHYWKISEKTGLTTNISHQFGSIRSGRLDFNFTRNPDPSFYRNLPSFYSTFHDASGAYLGNTPEYQTFAAESRDNFLANRQIDWNGLYQANIENGQSLAVAYEDRTDDRQWAANTILASQLSDNIFLNAGANFRTVHSQNYQMVTDLLGGSSYLDIDPFLTQFGSGREQADLNNPDRSVVVGDRFGYNYNLRGDVIDAFTQFKFSYRKIDFYLAQSFSRSQYQREGIYNNGNYPNSSQGKSAKAIFENFGFKGGITYKINGRNFIDLNGIYMTKAPTMRNTFPNARMNNNIVDNLQSEAIVSADASYILRTPKLKAKLTGFYSRISNVTDIGFYFAEGIGVIDPTNNLPIGGNGNAFVAEVVSGITRLNMGAELGFEYQLTSTIKATAAAAYGQFTFDSDPNVKLNIDNVRAVVDYGRSTMRNYRQAGMPQQAYSVGLEYRDPAFWWIGANANYLADNYIDVSPILRTDNFFKDAGDPDGFPFEGATTEEARRLLQQEKFDPLTLVNLVGGKSWRTNNKNRNTIGFFATINNVFDITYRTGGFEQARNANFQQLQQDFQGPARSFGPKYFYGFGRTYFLNIYYNF
jgi:hypothetical protein